MEDLHADKQISFSATPILGYGMAEGIISLCASILLHLAIAGGIIMAFYEGYSAGGHDTRVDMPPIYVTLLQEPAPTMQTPDALETAKRQAPAKKQEDPLPEPVAEEKTGDIKTKTQEPAQNQKSAPQQLLRTSPAAASNKTEYPSYAGGSGQEKIRYQDIVRAAIEAHRFYPHSARRRNIEGDAVIKISISKNGSILTKKLVKGTGHHILDQTVLDIVDSAAPLPAVPPSLPAPLSLNIPIGFKLK
ncbi:MAG: energy transducer TonB [Rhodospirillales bacterium]|nr:energy transducer TonB [Rhodospirillales bacterium]MCB9996354.1 energy transducer TonB [Rhodospirillales bacterium]